MPLTPQDVANKEFLTVRLREGYDMQEVDEFLDLVETSLRDLYDENERLKTAAASGAPAPTDVDAAREAAEQARVTDTGLQRAVTDPEQAPAAALTILTHAQTAADNLVNEAKARADELINDATATADRLVSEATQKAEALDAETASREEQLMGALQAKEADLRARLDDLRAHEREYRSRLVAYHSEQVRRLQEGQQEETDVDSVTVGSISESTAGEPAEPSGDDATQQ